jgi:hypothetical protein
MRLASWPRPTTRPARPGPDRTGRQCGCSLRQPSRYQHRELSVATTCTRARCRNVRKPGPCPMSARSCPASTWTPRSDRLSDTACPVVSGRTPSTPPGTPWQNRKRRGQGTDERHGRRSDILDRHDQRRPARTRRAPPAGPAFAAWQPRLARRWQDRQRDRNHGSDQAAGWCRSTVQATPWCIALLGRLRVERRASGARSSVMGRALESAGLLLRSALQARRRSIEGLSR